MHIGILILAMGFCSYVLFSRALQAEYDPDLFWHLAQGEQLLNTFDLPIHDTFSLQHEGQAVRSAPWMFEVLVAKIHSFRSLDLSHLQYFKAALFLTSLALMLCLFFLNVQPTSIAAGLLTLTFGMVFKFVLRPDTVATPLILITTLLGYSFLGSLALWNSIALLGVLFFWVNFHASAIYGFIIAFSFLTAALIQQRKSKNKKYFIFLLLAVAIISCLGWHQGNPILSVLSFSSSLKSLITEFQPLNLSTVGAAAQAALVAIFIVFCLSVYFRRLAPAAIIGVFFYASLQSVRMLAVLFIVCAIPVAFEFDHFFKSPLFKKISPEMQKFIYALFLLIFLVPVPTLTSLAGVPPSSQLSAKKFPTAFLSDLTELPAKTAILADYNIGGFVIYFSPQSRVLIDGRTNILYTEEDLKLYNDVGVFPEVFKSVTEKYNFDWILANTYQDNNNLGLLATLSGKYSVHWLTNSFAGLKRGPPYLITPTVLLYYPSCHSQLSKQDIEVDLKNVVKHPSESNKPIEDTLKLLLVLGGIRKEEDLGALISTFSGSSLNLRLLALKAEEFKNYNLATELINQIDHKIVWDYLRFAKWQLELGHGEIANKSLTQIPDLGRLSLDQLKIFAMLHDTSVRMLGGKTYFETARMNAFREIITHPGTYTAAWNDPNCRSFIDDLRRSHKGVK